MSSSAVRYHPRAPRYVFRPEDESLMRFAGMEKRASRARARIRNLSTSGLLIAVGSDQTPSIGDLVKIEFGLPERKSRRKQIAWFATVVRVAVQDEWDSEYAAGDTTLVGLRFHKLPEPFRFVIHTSIKDRVKSEEEDLLDRSTRNEKFAFYGYSAALLVLFVLLAIPPRVWFHAFH